jgi:LysM repeat protein
MNRKWISTAIVMGALTTGLVAFSPAAASSSTQCGAFYTVQRGDTLARIARQFGRTVNELQTWNNISDPNRIYAGRDLCVTQITIVDPTSYTVQRGDTLARIARTFGISWRVLAEVNKISNPNLIYVGQVLTIPEVTIQS